MKTQRLSTLFLFLPFDFYPMIPGMPVPAFSQAAGQMSSIPNREWQSKRPPSPQMCGRELDQAELQNSAQIVTVPKTVLGLKETQRLARGGK